MTGLLRRLLVTTLAAACSPDSKPRVEVTSSEETVPSAIDCPKDGTSLDQEFGAGTTARTRCLKKHSKIKIVYQLNRDCKDTACEKPYGLRNIGRAIEDYEDKHGLKQGDDYEIAAVVHGRGFRLILDNANAPEGKDNPFQTEVEVLQKKGVVFYLCQNTARHNDIQTKHIMPGIRYVTAAVTAIPDFQQGGYVYIQP